MKVLKLLVAALVLSVTTTQAQTGFLHNLKAMLTSSEVTSETNTLHHSTFSVENMDNESVMMLWESASVDGHYEIERSAGDDQFVSIVSMNADGSPFFSFIDNEPMAENIYRLKHVSRTGKVSYSEETYISLLDWDLTLESLGAGEAGVR